MKTISVIVPIYKVESYLPECLDSILASTYQNLEILLVDDGSPDRYGEICDEYARRDSRIRVIHQENQGLVGARNAGLRQATGEYIAFVDSDDCVSPVMFERMATVMEQTRADIVCCEYDTDWSKVLQHREAPAAASACFDTYDGQLAVLIGAPAVRSVTCTNTFVWNKLYRRARIQVAFLEEYNFSEDLRFNWDYIANSHSMAILPEKLYYYRKHPDSVTSIYWLQKPTPAIVKNAIINAKTWNLVAHSALITDPELRDYLFSQAAFVAQSSLRRIYAAGAERTCPAFVKTSRCLIRENWGRIWKDTETYSKTTKCIIAMYVFLFPLWKLAARLSRYAR